MQSDPFDVLEFLLTLSSTLTSLRTPAELLPVVAQQARRLLGAARATVLTLDQTNRFLLHVAADPPVSTAPEPIPLYNGDGRNTRSASAHAAFTGRIVALPDIYAFTGFDFAPAYEQDRLLRSRTRSFVAFPLRNHDAMTIGVVQVFDLAESNLAKGALQPWAERGVGAFAPMAAVAMTNLRLLEEKQALIRRLGRSNASLEEENALLKSRVVRSTKFPDVIGNDQAMQEVYKLVARTLDSKVTVLLNGETGTGKEVVAQAIHRNSTRSDGPFIVQNCAALPEQLLESELFGHRRGAFTGAVENKTGLFQAADKGTLFLDEIGDMPLGLQAKILRVLQDSEVRPIGETRSRTVDVRIIAATHKDLRERVRRGEFREDLFYRLCIFPILLPPLRERRSDILPLAEHFTAQAAAAHGRPKPRLSAEAAAMLESFDFPGNVRELKNAVERALLLMDAGGMIEPAHLPKEITNRIEPVESRMPGPIPPDASDLRTIVQRYETVVISSLLEDHGWNQTRTAQVLGISRRSLVEKIQRYAIRRDGPAQDWARPAPPAA